MAATGPTRRSTCACFPRSAASTPTAPPIGGLRPRRRSPTRSARRCYVYDEDELRARCREYRDALRRRRGRVRGQGVPLHRDGAPRRRGGAPPRRRDRRRAPRRAAGRVPAGADRVPRQQQVATTSSALALELGVGPASSSTRSTSSTASRRSSPSGAPAPRVLVRVTPGRRGAHARVHRDRRRRLEVRVHRRRTARRATPRCGWRRPTRSTSSASTATSARRSSCSSRTPCAAAIVAEPGRRGRRRASASRSTRSTSAAGSGVPYIADDLDAPSIAELRGVVRDGVRRRVRARPVSTPRRGSTVEAGRSIAGPAGITLYRVGTVKEIPGVRTYVAVDGGMSDNPRPVTYGAGYEAFLPARITERRGRSWPRWRASTASRATSSCGRAPAGRRRGRRRARDAGHRAPTATRWRPTTTWCRGRRSCSSATATPGSSCAGRRSTISSRATSPQ